MIRAQSQSKLTMGVKQWEHARFSSANSCAHAQALRLPARYGSKEMSDQYNVVLGASKKLETLLSSIGSEGRGLHEKCGSVEHLLPPDIVWSIRMVATIRNKLLHEDGYELRDIGDFLHQAGSAIDYLEKASKPEPAEPKRKGLEISSPDRIINNIPIAEMEWFSKQPTLFPYTAKTARNPDPDD